ncbi:MAG: hypothetical protein IJT77_10905, partial [Clostridia bacterium]|nr:hypothetical protein [Clostridia bacterium]
FRHRCLPGISLKARYISLIEVCHVPGAAFPHLSRPRPPVKHVLSAWPVSPSHLWHIPVRLPDMQEMDMPPRLWLHRVDGNAPVAAEARYQEGQTHSPADAG